MAGSPSLFLEEVVWNVPRTFFCICLPVFFLKKGYLEGSPNYSLHLSPSLLLWKVPPTPVNQSSLRKRLCGRFPHFFPNRLSFGSSAIVKVLSKMTRLSSWVLCSKWLSPSKRFFGKVPQTVRLTVPFGFFGQMAVASAKVLWRVPPTILYIPPNGCWFSGGFRQLCITFISQSPPGVKVA